MVQQRRSLFSSCGYIIRLSFLYIGAAFTRARAVLRREGIKLKKDAVYVVRRESLKFEDVDSYPEDMNKMPKVSAPTVYGV
jgi:hypothetical protein